LLDYHGLPQARWALELLQGFCEPRFVSIRAGQAAADAYQGLPSITDLGASAGPASGLQAALRRFPNAAWLVIAADMPLLERAVLARLATERDAAALATAYRHADGTPEPLCAIWEPAALEAIEAGRGEGGTSLRRLLEMGPAKLLEIDDEKAFFSVNTLEDDKRIRQCLADAESARETVGQP
jgi:molybdopterin-guanine dinucleotide biosynthesis protein A